MSLTARRILITRAPHQASELADTLRTLGAIPILIPTIEIAAPTSYAALDAALTCLRTYDWLVFTSANAVEAFHRRAQAQHLTQLPRKIAAIGPATERAVNAIGLTVDLVPPKYIAESLAESLLPEAPQKSFLLVRAATGPNGPPATPSPQPSPLPAPPSPSPKPTPTASPPHPSKPSPRSSPTPPTTPTPSPSPLPPPPATSSPSSKPPT